MASWIRAGEVLSFVHAKLRDSLLHVSPQAREESPVAVKHAGERVDPDGKKTYLYWMKAKTEQKYPASLQKVCISSLSSIGLLTLAIKVHNGIHFRPSLVRGVVSIICSAFENAVPSFSISPAITGMGLKRSHDSKGPKALGMGVRLPSSFSAEPFTNASSTSRAWTIPSCSMSEFVDPPATLC